jgi:hypothetical protein
MPSSLSSSILISPEWTIDGRWPAEDARKKIAEAFTNILGRR